MAWKPAHFLRLSDGRKMKGTCYNSIILIIVKAALYFLVYGSLFFSVLSEIRTDRSLERHLVFHSFLEKPRFFCGQSEAISCANPVQNLSYWG